MELEQEPDYLNKAQQHLEQAYRHEEIGELEQALRECETAVAWEPDLAEAHNLQGIILEQLGREKQAIAAYRNAVRLDPRFEDAWLNLNEVQDEVRLLSQMQVHRPIWRLARWGALGFGLGLAVVNGILALLSTPVLVPMADGVEMISSKFSRVELLAFAIILYGLAAAVGAGTLAIASGPRKVLLTAGGGALAFGTCYGFVTLVGGLAEMLLDRFLGDSPTVYRLFTMLRLTITFSLSGVTVGLLVGLILRGARHCIPTALAGLAFGLWGLCWLAMWPLSDAIFSGPFSGGPVTLAGIAFQSAGRRALEGALAGAIGGAALGFGLARSQERPILEPAAPQG